MKWEQRAGMKLFVSAFNVEAEWNLEGYSLCVYVAFCRRKYFNCIQ